MRSSYASYPVELPVRFHTMGESPVRGEGWTLIMSGEVVRFQCNRRFEKNQSIQLVIAWPADLPDGTRLNLWILGSVVACAAGCVEVRVGTYEFKTRPEARRTGTARRKGPPDVLRMTAGS